jgi:hypothetical protein
MGDGQRDDYKGMSGEPKSRSIRTGVTERGIAFLPQGRWRRRTHSSPISGKLRTWRRGPGDPNSSHRKVLGMRNAEPVLAIIRDRGKRGLPLEDSYRQLYNPDLYLRADGRLYANDGAMTPGSTEETVDGMSIQKIQAIIDALRYERYRWTPVKRVFMPKRNGKLRPLGLPSWSDKLLQEVMRLILEA